MFIVKNKYFLIIENIKDFDLKNIKIRNKFYIIYRYKNKINQIKELFKFRKMCKSKAIRFYVANNIKLALTLHSDGIYLSSFNKDLGVLKLKRKNFKIIGSAHNFREIKEKSIQGCSSILLSKLFKVDYDVNSDCLGVVRFNTFFKFYKKIIPLGGIKGNNLNNLKNISSEGFALLSEVKKKPAKIFNRLF